MPEHFRPDLALFKRCQMDAAQPTPSATDMPRGAKTQTVGGQAYQSDFTPSRLHLARETKTLA